MRVSLGRGSAVLALLAAICATELLSRPDAPVPAPTVGNADALRVAFARWDARAEREGADRSLVLHLGYLKGLSRQYTPARGRMTLDLVDGTVRAEVSGLETGEALDLWLVDNLPDGSIAPGPGDGLVRVGRLEPADGRAALEARLDPEEIAGFQIDLVVAAAPGTHPGEGGLLFGMPTLFQKLGVAGRASAPEAGEPEMAAVFRALVPSVAEAQGAGGSIPFDRLVARGEQIFFDQTFDGNGRTCGTCHPAENNFTIDPAFIATLPPEDPLFVADPASAAFIPALGCDALDGCMFENPTLIREFGLILENLDGFDRPGVLRGVPHTLALPTSLTASSEDIANGFPLERTGWSADGAPGGGTLREFAIGAVTQHFPRTLDRIAGIDFRLPTDVELDALEAFQLSLGRQEDLDLSTLVLADADASQGQALFLDDDKGRCNACHLNAGANDVEGEDPNQELINRNFNTRVERLVDEIDDPELGREVRPLDGGFGASEPGPDGGLGDGRFNTTSLVEAADTGPFFHNNTVETIEGAVEFYTGTVFGDGATGVDLDPGEVSQVAAFLRVINALENIRFASELAGRAGGAGNAVAAMRLLRLALAETEDAIEVLAGGMGGDGLHGDDAAFYLAEAADLLLDASETPQRPARLFLIGEALAALEAARSMMVAPTA